MLLFGAMADHVTATRLRSTSVQAVLEAMRIDAVALMEKRLAERPGLGGLDPSEILSIARIAGLVAKTVAADAVNQAFQMGIDRTATSEDYEAVTVRQTSPYGMPAVTPDSVIPKR